ncbi:hypothetical protein [Bradyrhizobium sediminis]|nr:hypothetical protein [Bradyrhizobium sediminis]
MTQIKRRVDPMPIKDDDPEPDFSLEIGPSLAAGPSLSSEDWDGA